MHLPVLQRRYLAVASEFVIIGLIVIILGIWVILLGRNGDA